MAGAEATRPDEANEDALPLPGEADPAEVLRIAAEASEQGVIVVMATVIAHRGSTPSTPGQRLVLLEGGACFGTIGGGAVERSVLRALAPIVADAGSEPGGRVETYKLGPELGMCCGGSVDVLIERLVSRTPILLVGAGHIGRATAPLLAKCGFAVTVADERDAVLEGDDASTIRAVRRVTGDFAFAGKTLPRRAAALAMTHDHQLDQRVVEWALREKFAFVGGVGSRAKGARTRARLEAKGFSSEDIARVRMPIGAAIGARSPDEIAVSIVAEMIAWKRGAKK